MLACAFKALLPAGRVEVVSLDGYHTETRAQRLRSRRPAVDPGSNDLETARRHLTVLRSGRSVDIPTYDHTRGEFGPARRIAPAKIIVWEGLHALYPLFHELTDLRVFFDVEPRLKRQWRMARDVNERGYETDVLVDWLKHRDPAVTTWITPQRTWADLHFRYEAPMGELRLRGRISTTDGERRHDAKRRVFDGLSFVDLKLGSAFDLAIAWGDVHLPARVLASAGRIWATKS